MKIAVHGASGRMGQAVMAVVEESADAAVKGTVTSSGDPAAALRGADVAIEFALPQATAANLAACVAAKRPLVIGTTGHDDSQRAQIAAAAREIAIVMAPNMSLGVNLLLKLVELTAGKLDADYDIEIFEAHHRHKKDAPSGTALQLKAGIERAGYARPIDVSSTRAGSIPGTHTVGFDAAAETITLTHTARDRAVFARGALHAAQWLQGKRGWFTMRDVLGI